jgi:dipeptidyl aminopeptidase/acylaminoacyl peptidase
MSFAGAADLLRHCVPRLRILALLVWLSGAACDVANARALTLDDVLNVEAFGRVVVTPDGRTLLFEQQPPYETAPNIESLSGHVRDESGLGLVYSMTLGQTRGAQLLFHPAPRTGYWIGGLSPDGSKLALYSLSAGKVRAGVFDLARRRTVWFDFTPNYHYLQQRALWISNDELVYGAMPPGEQPSLVVYAPQIAARANGLWKKALERNEPSATVLSSSRDGIQDAEHFLPGTLLRVDARTGKARPLADGFFYALRLSADGRYLAALKARGIIQRAADRPAVGAPDRHQLVVFDLTRQSRGVIPCPTCNISRKNYDWSSTGSRLLFFASEVGKDLDSGQYYEYEASTDALRPVSLAGLTVGCQDAVTPARIVDVGASLAVFARPADSASASGYFRGLRECERGVAPQRYDWFLLNPGKAPTNLTSTLESTANTVVGRTGTAMFILVKGHVWRLNGADAPKDLTGTSSTGWREWNPRAASIRDFDFLEGTRPLSSGRAFFATADGLVGLDLQTEAVTPIGQPEARANVAALSLSPSGTTAAYFIGEESGAKRLMFGRLGQRAVTAATINARLADVDIPRQEELSFELEGKTLATCLKLPAEWAPGKRYPAIVWVYPGTTGKCVSRATTNMYPPEVNPDLLVTHGYIYMEVPTTPDIIGPTSVGKRSPAALAAIDRAAQAGYVDPERLGLLGFSQGNFSALGVLTETRRFRAAAIGNGISDMGGLYGQIPFFDRMSFFDWNAQLGIGFLRWERARNGWQGAKPWEDPAAYTGNSPYYLADRIDTPLLIMHTDFDIFDISQSEEMFMALYRQRKEAEYVTYWGEGHNLNSPANLRDWWRRLLAWYDRHLL